MPLAEKPNAVVTGAAGGLGRALSAELLRRGGRVVLADLNLDAARAAARDLGVDESHALECDVADLGSVERLAQESERLLGDIDLVANNAGVAAAGRVGEISIEDWKWCLGVNLWGVIHGCHVFVPRMRARGRGHILNVASTAGLIAAPTMGPYNVSKSGVVALSETMYGELTPEGIGVSVLCPTFFRTGIVENARMAGDRAVLGVAQGMMNAATIQADGVARIALDAVAADKLYVLPHRDGRMMWRFKRFLPGAFHRLTPRAMRLRAQRAGIEVD